MSMKSSETGTSATATSGDGVGSGGGGRGSKIGSSGNTCADCGNKAKKGCGFSRCRTCCKSRAFDCPTHVKSTWVPIARRRQIFHRRLALSAAAAASDPAHFFPSYARPHSGLEGASSSTSHRNFPAEVNALANFRCVRVSSHHHDVNNIVADQVAYAASVNVGGHLFKGVLYDQGPMEGPSGGDGGVGGGEGTSVTDPYHHFQHHHLHHQFPSAAMVATTTSAGGSFVGVGVASSSSGGGANLVYNSNQIPFYPSSHNHAPTPYNNFMPGLQFFPHPRTS